MLGVSTASRRERRSVNLEELRLTSLCSDDDDNGLSDGTEVIGGTDPLAPDTDGDGCPGLGLLELEGESRRSRSSP
jgi:hypothetical protein